MVCRAPEETDWAKNDLKTVKRMGTDGFSLRFYVFLKRKIVLCLHETFLFLLKKNAELLLAIVSHIPEKHHLLIP